MFTIAPGRFGSRWLVSPKKVYYRTAVVYKGEDESIKREGDPGKNYRAAVVYKRGEESIKREADQGKSITRLLFIYKTRFPGRQVEARLIGQLYDPGSCPLACFFSTTYSSTHSIGFHGLFQELALRIRVKC